MNDKTLSDHLGSLKTQGTEIRQAPSGLEQVYVIGEEEIYLETTRQVIQIVWKNYAEAIRFCQELEYWLKVVPDDLAHLGKRRIRFCCENLQTILFYPNGLSFPSGFAVDGESILLRDLDFDEKFLALNAWNVPFTFERVDQVQFFRPKINNLILSLQDHMMELRPALGTFVNFLCADAVQRVKLAQRFLTFFQYGVYVGYEKIK